MRRLLILCFALTCWSCEPKQEPDDEIYNLLQFVVVDQGLEKTHGLEIEPEVNISLDKSNKDFLTDLVIEEAGIDPTTTSSQLELTLPTTFEFRHTKCLTRDDVDFG